MSSDSHLLPGAEPFFFPGGPVGCLVVHGFTGTPKEMRWFGEYLAAQGYTVLGVRLAGHASQPQAMIRTNWQDWFASVVDGWHLLRGQCGRLFAAGLSMGGALSLHLSAHFHVDGVIAMSTPIHLRPAWLLNLIPLLQPFYRFHPKGPSDWRDPAAPAQHIAYPRYPVRAIGQLWKFLKTLDKALPRVTAPALLIHSRGDLSVPLSNLDYLYARLGSVDKEKLVIENSGHVVTEDIEREHVFAAAAEFIRARGGVG